MKIHVMTYSPGPFEANKELWDNIESNDKMGIDIAGRLRYRPQKDICGFQFDIKLVYKEEMLIKTGLLFGLMVDNLGSYIGDSLTKEVNTKSVAKISEFIWPFVVGAFAARCADKEIQMILPHLDFDKFAEEVLLLKSESSE